ncbi:hypothetical protein ABZP36_029359, partial [Zizania latifolia]
YKEAIEEITRRMGAGIAKFICKEGPEPLGPFGLQQVSSFPPPSSFMLSSVVFMLILCLQFYLDMKFVIIFGQGRFLSRNVHQVILDIIDGAMSAFSATGMNPDSFMPTHIGAETDLRFVYYA